VRIPSPLSFFPEISIFAGRFYQKSSASYLLEQPMYSNINMFNDKEQQATKKWKPFRTYADFPGIF